MRLLKLFSYWKKPWNIVVYLNSTRFKVFIPDKLLIKCKYRFYFNKKLNLKNPTSFNEKLQWLKLYDRNPKYTQLVDKMEVKKIVGELIGYEHIIPTYEVWENIADIDLNILPDKFVLKTTHDSHGVLVCHNRADITLDEIKEKFSWRLNRNYYFSGREWPYKNVKPRIIAEMYMTNDDKEIEDYKVHCFNGVPKFILVCSGRYSRSGLRETFYNLEWKKLSVNRPNCANNTLGENRPENLNEMIDLAKKLAKDMAFVRVDFYQIKGKTYFGELTFYPASGYKGFVPESFDLWAGNQIELPNMSKNNN